MSDGKSKTIYLPSGLPMSDAKSKTIYLPSGLLMSDGKSKKIYLPSDLPMYDGKKHGLFITFIVIEKIFGETLSVIVSACCHIYYKSCYI
jgi:hypothetical protein